MYLNRFVFRIDPLTVSYGCGTLAQSASPVYTPVAGTVSVAFSQARLENHSHRYIAIFFDAACFEAIHGLQFHTRVMYYTSCQRVHEMSTTLWFAGTAMQ